ncbi:MAG: SDR family NAD(P)-dependent oxidoreductase [Bacteroidota bacterium]|nr:SDR family NAD(P)-dependent oxidoreductase [Bacteroidota bacterium]MDP4233407.1 SDR family NAD(P)-dependent oxidoreductase [Bacteroidota bacterium]MDP4242273.1 SDR family NAD(P)-dependent oxidoreductase [Bacteroidota bacterium]MDP4287029.1 SDR family NAD(P)-dependent oxidoreductase [Bacteroidota bacterium]
MNLSGNTILITGGATGIGLAMARAFVAASNTVLVSGRRDAKLMEAKVAIPELLTKVSDISDASERTSLADWARSEGVNILINNAGIQREIDLKRGIPALDEGDNEFRINFEGAVYLTAGLMPHLLKQQNAAICNVSSGLGFIPIASMPIYCATKAAIHSYTISLRHQLQPTGIKVFEIIPPTVDTELDRGARARRGQTDRGIPAMDVAEAAIKGMSEDKMEIAVGMAANLMSAPKDVADQIFRRMNGVR